MTAGADRAGIAAVTADGGPDPHFLRRRSSPGATHAIGGTAEAVLAGFERVVRERQSEVILLWPQRPDSVAVFHSLAAMRRLKDCDREPLTTLFYPWVRNIAGSQRGLLVDRTFLADAAHKVLNRIAADGFKSRTSGFVMALHSLGHLMTSGKKNTVFKRALKLDPGLEHPSLFEVSIQRGVTAEGLQPYDHFLGRLRRCTWINEAKERLRAAMTPGETPFLLVGIHSAAPVAKSLRAAGFDPRHGGVIPQVLLLDLTRSSRDRLEHWRRAVPGLLGVMSDLYGASSPPALAVTDDPFILQALRWEVLKRYDQRRTGAAADKTPTRARAILSTNPDIIEGQAIVSTGLHTVRVETYGNDILSLVDAGLKLRKALVHAEDYELADTVSDVISVAQAMVGAPAATPQLHEFIGHHAEGYERQRVGARFDYLKPTGEMKTALQQGVAGAQHGALSKLLRSFGELCDRTRASSASQILCDESLRRLVAQGGRVLVVCSSEFICGLLLWRIENDETLASVRAQLGQGVVIADRREAIEQLAEGAAGRFDRVFFVEPQADDLLHVLVTQENPIEAHVLCNLARAEQSLRRVRILIGLTGTEPVSAVLRAVQTELERVLKGRSSDIPDLDDELPLPRVRTVDLTGDDAPALGNRRVLRTAGGIVIRAYDGSEIAVYDPDSVQVFSRKLAKDVTPDDRICVFTPDFVAMAREKLHLSRDASDVLGLYHETVVKAVRQLAGKDVAAKIRTLRGAMQHIDGTIQLPSDHQLRYWIDIEHLPGMARDEVTPHAPRDRRHFLCFMQALGIGPDVARHYWDLGIFWTRSMRLRSGASFHQVFMGILIDPHGTAAMLRPDRREEVWRILETAEQHVVTVSSNAVEVHA